MGQLQDMAMQVADMVLEGSGALATTLLQSRAGDTRRPTGRGSWTDFYGYLKETQGTAGADDERGNVTFIRTAELRVVDSLTLLEIGDQVRRSGETVIYEVIERHEHNGWNAYSMTELEVIDGGPDRGRRA